MEYYCNYSAAFARRETVGLKAKAPSGLFVVRHEAQREGRRMRRPYSLRSRVML